MLLGFTTSLKNAKKNQELILESALPRSPLHIGCFILGNKNWQPWGIRDDLTPQPVLTAAESPLPSRCRDRRWNPPLQKYSFIVAHVLCCRLHAGHFWDTPATVCSGCLALIYTYLTVAHSCLPLQVAKSPSVMRGTVWGSLAEVFP